MNKSMVVAVMAVCAVAGAFATSASAAEYLSGIKWAMPAIVDTGPGSPTSAAAPSDAVVLFDGTDMSKWEGADNWVVQDGCVIAGPGEVKSKEVFGDCQVHIEWSSDEKAEGSGQGRSNSGVFLMDVYEIQVLDSYNNETYFDGQCGAIYKQHPPLANATRPPGQWQTYDIIWTSPRFADGKLVSPAFVTLLHNGVLVQNHFQLEGDTPYHRAPEYQPHADKGSIRLQYHGNPVRFRNIWVRETKELERERVHEPKVR